MPVYKLQQNLLRKMVSRSYLYDKFTFTIIKLTSSLQTQEIVQTGGYETCPKTHKRHRKYSSVCFIFRLYFLPTHMLNNFCTYAICNWIQLRRHKKFVCTHVWWNICNDIILFCLMGNFYCVWYLDSRLFFKHKLNLFAIFAQCMIQMVSILISECSHRENCWFNLLCCCLFQS